MIFKSTLPHSKKWPPSVARQLSKIKLLGELITIPPTDNYVGGVTRPVLTITTWGSVKEAPSGGVTWHARVDVSLPAAHWWFATSINRDIGCDRYGSAYSSASGYGYCKESAAAVCALRKLLAEVPQDMPSPGSGMGSLLLWLRQQGWRTAEDILQDKDRP